MIHSMNMNLPYIGIPRGVGARTLDFQLGGPGSIPWKGFDIFFDF